DAHGTELCRTEDWIAHYRSLDATATPGPAAQALDSATAAFVQAASPPLLDAFTDIAAGRPGFRVHYPRARPYDKEDTTKCMPEGGPVPPNPEGAASKWFVENERERQDRVIHGLALPPAGTGGDPSLPVHNPDPEAEGNRTPPRPAPGPRRRRR